MYCASSVYLKKHGEPQVPQFIAAHHRLLYSNADKPGMWTFHGPQGIGTVRVSGSLTADSGDILRAASAADLGVSFMPTFIDFAADYFATKPGWD